MTEPKASGILSSELILYRPDIAHELLAPLTQGKAVILFVNDKRLPKKTRAYKPLLVICPMTVLGVASPCFLVSMPPYGSEIVDVSVGLKANTFVRLGLSFSLSRALVDALRLTLWRPHG